MSLTIAFLISLLPLFRATFIPHPPQVQVEGVAHAAGTNFLFADLRTGDIYLADVSTRLVTRAVRAPPNRTSVGIHSRKGRIFAAGGGAPFFPVASLYVYDTATGNEIAACPVRDENALVNDVIADRDYAYYTDSLLGRIYKLSLAKLPECDIDTIHLPQPLFKSDLASANGLVKYKGGIILVHLDLGTIFFVDLLNRNRVQQILPPGSMLGADGLDIDRKKGGSLLFVAQNRENLISQWRLGMGDDRKVSAVFLRKYSSPQFGIPTTVAVTGDYIVAPTSRFDTVEFTEPIPDNVTLGLVVFRR